MRPERFKKQEKASFFGDFVYDRVVPSDHFLRKLDAVVPWPRFTKKLVKLYRGKGREGRPPYDPAVLLKMLLVVYLYDLSERQTEVVANDSLSIKWFLGLAVDEPAPDHSTLTKFKERLLEKGKLDALEDVLGQIIALAAERGIRFGQVQVMDSVHTVADVNVEKDERRQEREGKPPRDEEAHWGVKGSRRYEEPGGKRVRQREYFFGYKTHCSLNAENGLITSVSVTPGNANDGHQMPGLLDKDRALGLPLGIVTADRGYDDGANHFLLQAQGLHSAIRLNDYRTQKKDANKEIWLELEATAEYQQGLKERYKIERKFGEAKQWHGLRRCRYLGCLRYGLQALVTAIVLNLKRLVKLLMGVSFREAVRVTA